MYERFTDRTRRVMQFANTEANRLNHEYIGTEHILLGLIKDQSSVACNVLRQHELNTDNIRKVIEELVQPGPDMNIGGKLPYTPHARQAIQAALASAIKIGDDYIGTEHILLGLLMDRSHVACAVLERFAPLEEIEKSVLEFLPTKEKNESEADALEIAKQEAIANQDFDKAKAIQIEIDSKEGQGPKEHSVSSQHFSIRRKKDVAEFIAELGPDRLISLLIKPHTHSQCYEIWYWD